MIDTKINQANELYLKGLFAEAATSYQEILNDYPDHIGACHNLGLTYYQMEEYKKALELFDHAYKLGSLESLVCRGNCYRALNQYQLSLADYGQSFIENLENAGAYCNYGNTLRELGKPNLAIPFLQVAQKLDPTNITAKFNEAVAHLLAGDLLQGWELYESRWEYEHQKGLKPSINRPELTKEIFNSEIQGKTILLYSEQGFGDTIQFCRYIPSLQAMGAKILLVTRPDLLPLFNDCQDFQVRDSFENLPNADYHCALLSLPRIFGTTLETIPAPIKYLDATEKDVAAWKKLLGPKTKMRVGITWSGNRTTWINRYKSMQVENLEPLLSEDYQFINLQHDATNQELEFLKEHNVLDFTRDIKNFDHTASLIANLDLVITVDTAVAHLSGALGIPTWIMLNAYGTDWRWLLDRKDNPWYPTARLFRQPSPNDWSTVVNDVQQHLKLFKI